MKYSLNIIGCGRLGSTLGFLLAEADLVTIAGICNAHIASSHKAVQFLGQGTAVEKLADLPIADIYLVTVPDHSIAVVGQELLSTNKNIRAGSFFLHCSGVLSAEILNVARAYGGKIASLHPIKSFANPLENIHNFAGTYCSYEGDAEACNVVRQLMMGIGAHVFPIASDQKAIYHAGGVFSANYLVGLFDIAKRCYTAAGIEADIAHQITMNIMLNTLKNLERLTPQQALTGPIQRGDTQTITQHGAALTDENLAKVYAALGNYVLSLTQHDDNKKFELRMVLADLND